MMMRSLLLLVIVAVAVAASVTSTVAAFQVKLQHSPSVLFRSKTVLQQEVSSSSASEPNVNNHNAIADAHEVVVSRRDAIASAAATATGTTATAAAAGVLLFPFQPPEAKAAASPIAHSIAETVESLETKYAGTVNTEGAPEKHLPTMSILPSSNKERRIQISVPHVMDPEKPHYIQYLWLKDVDNGKVIATKQFQPTDASPPTMTVTVLGGSTVKALLFCNLHGLWQGEEMTV